MTKKCIFISFYIIRSRQFSLQAQLFYQQIFYLTYLIEIVLALQVPETTQITMNIIEIDQLKASLAQSAKKIKIFEDLMKSKDQTIKKLKASLKQSQAIIKDKDQQIEQLNALNPYWTDPVKQSQLVCKIMERSQNPNLKINKEDQDVMQKNSKKLQQAFSLIYDMLKQQGQQFYQAKNFAEKDPKFFIEQPLKLIELYKLVVKNLKTPITTTIKEASLLEKNRQFEIKINIYEKFASDLKEALQYCGFHVNIGQKDKPQYVETKGLAIMQQNMIKLYSIRREEEIRYQKAGVKNFESVLKEHLLDIIENIRGSIIFCYQGIDRENEENKKQMNEMSEKVKKLETKNKQSSESSLKILKDKIREAELMREKEKFEYSVEKKQNQAYSFNLKSILLIAYEQVKRLQGKVNELEDKQSKLKQILKL